MKKHTAAGFGMMTVRNYLSLQAAKLLPFRRKADFGMKNYHERQEGLMPHV